jgi:hypothetical protein
MQFSFTFGHQFDNSPYMLVGGAQDANGNWFINVSPDADGNLSFEIKLDPNSQLSWQTANHTFSAYFAGANGQPDPHVARSTHDLFLI